MHAQAVPSGGKQQKQEKNNHVNNKSGL